LSYAAVGQRLRQTNTYSTIVERKLIATNIKRLDATSIPSTANRGKAGAWFFQGGGGVGYKSLVNLETLLKRGIIKEITP
jgi:hypothetical protein